MIEPAAITIGPRRSKTRIAELAERIGLAAMFLFSVALIFWVLAACRAGLDFTDEGYYLNWISNPFAYPASHTQFGFVYHPLYLLFQGDIVLLRQANLLLTLTLGFIVFFKILEVEQPQRTRRAGIETLPRAMLALACATSALAILFLWLPTPSYNTLALHALLVATFAVLQIRSSPPDASIAGCVLFGVAEWMALMAKPTTAAALGLMVYLYFFATGKMSRRFVLISVSVTLVAWIISAWAIDGSIMQFIRRFITGADDIKKLQGKYSLGEIFRIDYVYLFRGEKTLFAVDLSVVSLTTYLGLKANWIGRSAVAVVALAFSVAGLFVLAGVYQPTLPFGLFYGLQFGAIPLGVLLALLLTLRNTQRRVSATNALLLAVLFSCFPHILVFGSNNNYLSAITAGAVFWGIAGLVLLMGSPLHSFAWREYLPIAAAIQCGTFLLLNICSEYPFRQSHPLRENTETILVAGTGARLRVSRETSHYIATLGKLARENGFKIGDPVVDLTGHFPAAIYVLGGKSIGLAWLCGGYTGSPEMVTAALDRVSADELKRAWILTEPNGPRRLPDSLLQRYHLDLRTAYIDLGVVASPTGEFAESYEQHLLRPLDWH